ncbi:GNAT family N-acetyltransferase [bacterium]|nr:GNAT family N-acetyltransferase [bacterium]
MLAIDPLTDPRWTELVNRHPNASVFHTRGWLEALRRTYGYEPIVYTTTPPGADLENGIPFCVIKSCLTGRRIVSLPFSDYCEPLLTQDSQLVEILHQVAQDMQKRRLSYVEIRPVTFLPKEAVVDSDLTVSRKYCLHRVNLTPSEETLLGGFHESCVRRRIKRAERECLTIEEGHSDDLLTKFYHLLIMTRRKHQLPPQPLSWFRCLIECLGKNVTIRVASKDDIPVASIVTLFHRETCYYKYGCSDPHFANLSATPMLFWRAILDAKASGATEFDLGRSEPENVGLVTFKDRWNSKRTMIEYYRHPSTSIDYTGDGAIMHLAKRVFSILPDKLFELTGNTMYRHMG